MARISVVVPIYNVEAYLDECLRSVAEQTFTDLEVVLVDDGSTDSSAAIASRYVERDPRFRLVSQANGGLGNARNTGTEHATGELLIFLDSDDVLPPNAYELLVGALDKTGSDFATGNVHRLSRWGTTPAVFLARAFAETQLKTHVRRYRPLLADRTAWNKLWRRSFWDSHGFRFPEGRMYEDTPVTLPAHFAAKSVDVIADPVYYWRARDGADRSITQRRLEARVLLDRLQAVREVSDHLARHGSRKDKRWYDSSVVGDDLRLHLNVLAGADDEYRALFFDRVNEYLDTASPGIFDDLKAIDRLKWHLVRRRLEPELLEVLRFEREDLGSTPPRRIGRRWYGDYPFFGDRRLDIPRSVYRLGAEFAATVRLEKMTREGDRLKLSGFAFIGGIGAPERDSQRVQVSALRPGRLRRVRLLTSAARMKTSPVQRPDVTAIAPSDASWSGFDAVLDPGRLKLPRRASSATWEVFVTIRAGGVKRRRARFAVTRPHRITAVELPAAGPVRLTASLTDDDALVLEAGMQFAILRAQGVDDDVLELRGDVRLPQGATPKLRLRPDGGGRAPTYPVAVDAGSFVARLPLADLRGSEDERCWAVAIATGRGPLPLEMSDDMPDSAWPVGGREIALLRARAGTATIVDRDTRPVLSEACWLDDGSLELGGVAPAAFSKLALVEADRGLGVAVPARGDGPFTIRFAPARLDVAGGPLPLREGTWELRAERGGATVPVAVHRTLEARLPLAAVVDGKSLALGLTDDGTAVLVSRRDLGDDERGWYNQAQLRKASYAARRTESLRDSVLYMSFGGRQYADSPRAIHEELARLGAPLEHLWLVRDGQCRVPPTATAIRSGSREFHEALARSRFVVTNDRFPEWFTRRPDQICIQTWHGTPLRRRRPSMSGPRTPRLERDWERQVPNWQYVLSPNRFATPLLREDWAIEGEILETGHPRVDRLIGPDREARGRQVRRSLGVPDGARTVLYAPAYRHDAADRRGRSRFETPVDLERLRRAAGDDAVLLLRRHPYVNGATPASLDDRVLDVSTFPDATELLMAADVLITDYSSVMVDFVHTGRPVLLFAYDLDAYDTDARGFHVDLAGTAPGPVVTTAEALLEAVADVAGAHRAHRERYEAFRARFCELDDGRASARVVERLFSA